MGKASFLFRIKMQNKWKILWYLTFTSLSLHIECNQVYIFKQPFYIHSIFSVLVPNFIFIPNYANSIVKQKKKIAFPFLSEVTPPLSPSHLERMECIMSSTESERHSWGPLVPPWIWLLTLLFYCDNDSRLLFSVRNGGVNA